MQMRYHDNLGLVATEEGDKPGQRALLLRQCIAARLLYWLCLSDLEDATADQPEEGWSEKQDECMDALITGYCVGANSLADALSLPLDELEAELKRIFG